MSCYLQYIAELADTEKLADALEAAAEKSKAVLTGSHHSRAPQNIQSLLVGIHMFLEFSVQVDAITRDNAESMFKAAKLALQVQCKAQSLINSDASDADRFLNLLRSAVSMGHGHFDYKFGREPNNAQALGWRENKTGRDAVMVPIGDKLGWVDEENAYLDINACAKVVKRLANEHNNPLGVSISAIQKSLAEDRLIISVEKGKHTNRVTLDGVRRVVVHIALKSLIMLVEPTNYGHENNDDIEMPF